MVTHIHMAPWGIEVYVPGAFVTGPLVSVLGCRWTFILATLLIALGSNGVIRRDGIDGRGNELYPFRLRFVFCCIVGDTLACKSRKWRPDACKVFFRGL